MVAGLVFCLESASRSWSPLAGALVMLVWLRPDPGKHTVVRVWPWPTVTRAPVVPTDVLTPLRLRLTVMPGISLMRF